LPGSPARFVVILLALTSFWAAATPHHSTSKPIPTPRGHHRWRPVARERRPKKSSVCHPSPWKSALPACLILHNNRQQGLRLRSGNLRNQFDDSKDSISQARSHQYRLQLASSSPRWCRRTNLTSNTHGRNSPLQQTLPNPRDKLGRPIYNLTLKPASIHLPTRICACHAFSGRGSGRHHQTL